MFRPRIWRYRRAALGAGTFLAVLAVVYVAVHSVAIGVGLGLAAVALVTLGRPVRRRGPVRVHPAARYALNVAVYLGVLAAANSLFHSVVAGIAFGLAALYLIGHFWPMPVRTAAGDFAMFWAMVGLAAVWIDLTHGGWWLLAVIALVAAAVMLIPRWAALQAGGAAAEEPTTWPRDIGPRPLR